MIEFETRVLDIIKRTHNVKSFRLETGNDATFEAGQFFLATIKIEGKEDAKYFSFSNSPTEKGYIEFTKRITNSLFSQSLHRLKKGDWMRIKMPFGAFTFHDEHGKVAFLSGGIGITPLRSMSKFATDMKIPTDIVILYGNDTENDIIFKEDFDDMQKRNSNFRICYTLTSPHIDRKRWRGKTGYIDDRMIREEIPDYNQRVFSICGPPGMVQGLVSILKEKLGIQNDRIMIEKFKGY